MRSFAASLRQTHGLCHFCQDHVDHGEFHSSHLAAPAPDPTRPNRRFAFPGTRRVYERDRPFLIEHIALDLTLSFGTKSVGGTARIRAVRLSTDATSFALDAVGFKIESVEIDARPTPFSYDDTTLRVTVPVSKTVFDVVIRYHAHPKRGLYFLAPDDHVRDRPRQVWSQCQDEDARHWFPCHDKPHAKQTTELRVRVPSGLFALSNGKLTSRVEEGTTTVFSYAQELPHPSYLVTLVVGDFVELTPDAPTRVPLTYLVPPGREADGRRTFLRTPEMIALFEKKTGVPFPYAKYAQVVVSDFIFGGMENTSATTMYEHILLDERAAIDVDMDGLVAHELAHQWFGDFVTCRDFSEGWLNEGWATYMELVWKDEGTEAGAGRDEYDYALKGELDTYVDEDSSRYRRPIVSRDYENPIDLFDRHLYQKGALVLHRIRRIVGDGPFWRGVHRYLEAHANGVVETRDLQRAIEAESGKSLDRTFDLYVHGAGHPCFKVSIDVEERGEASLVSVSVEQTQPTDDPTRLYEGPIVIELFERGASRRETREMSTPRDTFVFSTSERPGYVAFDPEGDLLGTVEVSSPPDLLRSQLVRGSSARVRWSAANALAKRDDDQSIEALGAALAKVDEFWGVRAEAAAALGEIRTDLAFRALAKQVAAAHAKVRRAVVRALGKVRTAASAALLKKVALGDESYLVQADAARALGATRQPDAFDTLVELLDRRSWSDVVRSGAADGLAALRDERAVAHLSSRTSYGHDSHGRRSAMVALARLDTSRKTRELLEDRLDDTDPFVRQAAVRALDVLGDVKARGALARRLDREDSGNVRRRLREALRDLRGGHVAEVRALRDELERAREETKELRARMTKIEASLGPPAKGAARKAPKKARAPTTSKHPRGKSAKPKGATKKT